METRHKVQQVKAYLDVMQNPKNPFRDAVKEEKECTLVRGKSWMDQTEQSIQHVCNLTELKQERDWQKHPVEFKLYYQTLLSENLGMHCCVNEQLKKTQCRTDSKFDLTPPSQSGSMHNCLSRSIPDKHLNN